LGAITTKKGAVMAAAGFFRITITGVGGHGSAPQSARNPLETASRIVLASKDIIPDGCVLTICAVNGGSNSNVIPEQAELQGTLRFLDPEAGEKMIADFEKLCKKICADDNVKCDYVLDLPYPVTMNGDSGYNMAKKCAEKYLGTENFQELPASSMGSEDFAYYLQKYNGFFAFLGTGADAENLHTEKFDFKDSVLEAGIKFFVGLALEFKGEKK
jgi:amidohydrolase